MRILLFTLAFVSCQLMAEVKLPRLISDGAVLQRDKPIALWGYGAEGEAVELRLNNQLIGTAVTRNGRWQIQLPAQSAGGPHQIRVKGQNEVLVKDLYFGDVWVASGQSNMEMPMARLAEAYPADLAAAHFPLIRQFSVPQKYNFKAPQQDLSDGRWMQATATDIEHFSALAYFFARDLQQQIQVPVGILNNALGGSPVEAWLSEEALQAYPDALAEAKKFKNDAYIAEVTAADAAKNQAWYSDLAARDPGLTSAIPWFSQSFDDSSWPEIKLPGFLPEPFTGVWWLRQSIQLTEAQAKQATVLRLGSIVDADEAYLNGQKIAETTYQYPPRRYEIPAGLLKAGVNQLAVRITSTQGKTGLMPDKPYWIGNDQQQLALGNNWKMQLSASAKPLPGDTFIRWKPLGLYNGLTAPLTWLPVKGVIWYQGESNVGAYAQYQQRFEQMIHVWRRAWQQPDLPFLYVQLANFLEKTNQPTDSSWAGLREAQRLTQRVPHTAMVVALDTGEWNDIHPVDKRTLGQRLALAARAVAYQEPLGYRGPEIASVKAQGQQLVLSFHFADQGLVLKGPNSEQSFAIAGKDGRYVWAKVQQQGDQLLLSAPEVAEPVSVRYGWADNPDAVLYNGLGLPASSFEAKVNW
ncbi:sialate O-acetylesterase [Rheinheimera sp.]|uniref:sialate O-acetylesterase n=1 Tax=Rheinheimera sp. TaxID=1869214 RepID=UPI00307D603F